MNRTVYQHPDGFGISYNSELRSLECFDSAAEELIDIPIGEIGLLDLGLALITLAFEMRNAKEVK